MIANECCPPCPSVTVNVPGAPGTNGTPGAAGINAFTLTTGNFTIPAVNANVSVTVANSAMFAIGEPVFASDGSDFGTFQVVTVPDANTLQLKFLGYPLDAAPGAVINSGALVVPSGQMPATPVAIADGGTGTTTNAGAQTAFGLGQDPLVANSAGLTQVITNSFVEVGTCDITVTDVGTYLLLASAAISMSGVTFAASRNITLKIRNITQGVDIVSATFPTEILTTTNIPSFSLVLPVNIDSTAVANDHYQLMITIDTVNSAGTLDVISGNLAAVPLRLS